MLSAGDRPAVCIVHGGVAMPQALLGSGPRQMGGSEVQLAAIARGLRERGWPVTFAMQAAEAPASTPEGIAVYRLRTEGRGAPGVRFFSRTLPAYVRMLRETEGEVFLQMGLGWQSGLLAWACRRAGRRFVLWLASLGDAYGGASRELPLKWHERRLAQWGLRHADCIIAQTAEQQRLVKELWGREAVVIPNLWGVAEGPAEAPAQPPQVLWAARILELKRPHLALDVAEALPELEFVMAGGPAEGRERLAAEVRARAETLANVRFLGFVPFQEIDAHFARASACLCTSTIEGFPNIFLQAWSHGRPVVSTFDPDEVICRHGLGLHQRDFEGLVEGVREVCASSGGFRDRCIDYLAAHHSPETLIPRIEAVLEGR